MIEDKRKQVTINSPAGSGNMFCQYLMEENFHMRLRWVKHNPDLFDKNGINIFILRNPYDTIASGIEVNFSDMSEAQMQHYIKNLEFSIDDSISAQLENYNTFLNHAKRYDYITPVGFDLLTKQPDILLDRLSKKFDLPFKNNRVSAEEVKEKMQSVPNIGKRLPRKASWFRAEVNKTVRIYDPIKLCYNEYVEYKKNIELSVDNLLEY